MDKIWHLYIVRCSDNTYYTGITVDLARRLIEHNTSKRGARYTSKRRPVEMVYNEVVEGGKIPAMRREYRVKRFHRKKKEELIASMKKNLPPEAGDK